MMIIESYLLAGKKEDVVDYHNLKLIVLSSGNIFQAINQQKIMQNLTHTNAALNEYSAIASVNEKYLLASCLEDSLLTKINLYTGEFTNLLQYSDISTNFELTTPESICSISIFVNFFLLHIQ